MTKNSRSVIALISVMLFFFSSVSIFAQTASESNVQQPGESSVSSAETEPLPAWNWSSQESGQTASQPSTFFLFLKMVFALGIVLFLAYIAVRLLKRGNKIVSSDDPFLRHVSHLSLSTTRSVDVVTILDHAYILGVSDNSVNLIGQIDDAELVNSMNLYADKNDNTNRPKSFEDILSIFMPGESKKSRQQNIFGSSARDAAESLHRQRERLNGEE